MFTYPKYPDPSKLAILRTYTEDLYTPALQFQTLPLEGPMILRVHEWSMFMVDVGKYTIH